MACSTLTGVTFSLCEPSIGGISKIYLANVDDVQSITTGSTTGLVETVTADGVTEITMASGKKFQEFTLRKNTSNFTSTLNVNDNGSSYVSTVISYIMPRMDAAKRAAMQSLIMAEAIAIVKDSNGKYWLIGDTDNPLTNTAGTGETGTAKGDSNQYTVELTAEQNLYPYQVLASAVESVIE